MKIIRKAEWYNLLQVYDFLLKAALTILFGSMIILLFGEVVSRYFLNFPIMWSEELGRYLFIWIVYLGSALAFSHKRHINITFVPNYLPMHLQRFLEFFLYLVMMAFLFFVIIYGVKYAGMNMDRPAYAVRAIRMGWVYICAPIGAICMIINMIRIVPSIFRIDKKE
jgi:TRAP-type C4-dicarboxylate transport system permease small subunit